MLSLDNNTKAFLSLVRAGLWETDARLSKFEVIDYLRVLQLSEEQSVIGLVAAGFEKVSDTKVPKEIALKIVGQTLQLEQRNTLMNKYLASLVNLLRQQGIYSVLVKGQGVAQCYERPLLRACGDIDLYLNKDSFIQAKQILCPIAQKVDPDNEITEHINLVMKDGGWVVEIHANQHTDLSFKIDKGLDGIHRNIFYNGNVRSWDNYGTSVFLPSPENDIIIVFTHFIKHFFKGGLGLRQITDWCRLIWTYKGIIDVAKIETIIRGMGLLNEWKAFASFSVDYLGMPEDVMPLYSDKEKWSKKSSYILGFVLESGNFGHNRDTSYYQYRWWIMRKIGSFCHKVSDLFRHAIAFPDSLGFIPCIMYNGIKAAIRGE